MVAIAATATPASGLVDLHGRRIGALLNTSSGSCDGQSQADLEQILGAAGLTAAKVWHGPGAEVEQALSEAAHHDIEVLIVLGGDGTIRAAAATCDARGPLLMPLPGGTMNMLPKALYGDRDWRTALRDTLQAPVSQAVHGGRVGDHRFFIAALFGGPTRIAEAREAVREGELGVALQKGVSAVRQALSMGLRYRFGGLEGDAETVAVLCPLTSKRLDDDDEMLEAAAIDVEGALDTVRLALTALFRDWREDETVVRARVRSVEVSASETIPALLDGESFDVGASARVEFVPEAFLALRPAGAAA